MSNEQEQSAERHANLEALTRLGVPAYPTHFERTATVSAVVAEYGPTSAEALEAERPTVEVAGRVLGIRSFLKANFLVLSDGLARLQVYVREDSVDPQGFRVLTHLDFGDHIGVAG